METTVKTTVGKTETRFDGVQLHFGNQLSDQEKQAIKEAIRKASGGDIVYFD